MGKTKGELLDVFPDRPNQKVADKTEVLSTGRATRSSNTKELFTMCPYANKLVSYTPVQKPRKSRNSYSPGPRNNGSGSQDDQSSSSSTAPRKTPTPRSVSVKPKASSVIVQASPPAPPPASSASMAITPQPGLQRTSSAPSAATSPVSSGPSPGLFLSPKTPRADRSFADKKDGSKPVRFMSKPSMGLSKSRSMNRPRHQAPLSRINREREAPHSSPSPKVPRADEPSTSTAIPGHPASFIDAFGRSKTLSAVVDQSKPYADVATPKKRSLNPAPNRRSAAKKNRMSLDASSPRPRKPSRGPRMDFSKLQALGPQRAQSVVQKPTPSPPKNIRAASEVIRRVQHVMNISDLDVRCPTVSKNLKEVKVEIKKEAQVLKKKYYTNGKQADPRKRMMLLKINPVSTSTKDCTFKGVDFQPKLAMSEETIAMITRNILREEQETMAKQKSKKEASAVIDPSSLYKTSAHPVLVNGRIAVEYDGFDFTEADHFIRNLACFHDKHEDSIVPLLKLADWETIKSINEGNAEEFYKNEIIPAIENLKKFNEDPSEFHDGNRGKYERFVEGGVVIEHPLPSKPEVFPFQIRKRTLLKIFNEVTRENEERARQEAEAVRIHDAAMVEAQRAAAAQAEHVHIHNHLDHLAAWHHQQQQHMMGHVYAPPPPPPPFLFHQHPQQQHPHQHAHQQAHQQHGHQHRQHAQEHRHQHPHQHHAHQHAHPHSQHHQNNHQHSHHHAAVFPHPQNTMFMPGMFFPPPPPPQPNPFDPNHHHFNNHQQHFYMHDFFQ